MHNSGMSDWDQRNGNAAKDHAANRDRPSAQAKPVLLPKQLWPTEEELEPFRDPEARTVGVLKPLWCDRCDTKHVGFDCTKVAVVKPNNQMPRKYRKRK
jgi:hypothetical protein